MGEREVTKAARESADHAEREARETAGGSYSHGDVIQALAAALLFGRWGVGREGEVGGALKVGHATVILSDQAAHLLAEAWATIGTHGQAFGMYGGRPLTEHDIRRAVREGLSDISGDR